MGSGKPVIVGDIHWVQLPTANGHEQRGRRPAVILQDDRYAGGLPVVLVVPLTIARAAMRFAGTTLIQPTATHMVGKRHTQKIERKHLTFWTRLKRLPRKTICFSRSILMHDLVIGLFINRYAFGYAV